MPAKQHAAIGTERRPLTFRAIVQGESEATLATLSANIKPKKKIGDRPSAHAPGWAGSFLLTRLHSRSLKFNSERGVNRKDPMGVLSAGRVSEDAISGQESLNGWLQRSGALVFFKDDSTL